MKGKILVIEDDPNWQEDLKYYFESDGFYVDIVADLETAIIKIKNEMFHFITIDMRLDDKKDMNPDQFEGWELLQIVKKLRVQNNTPVMVITGYEIQYEKLKNEKDTNSLFFMGKGKGFDLEELLDVINTQVKRIDLRFKNDYRGD
jgi:DNA-binding response OmpR family regulator